MGSPSLIDTNILIDYLAGVPAAYQELSGSSDRAISVISRIELLAGAKGHDLKRAEAYLHKFPQIELTPAIVSQAIVLRRTTLLKLPDAVLLATAQIERRVLVTRNTKDFDSGPYVRIPYEL